MTPDLLATYQSLSDWLEDKDNFLVLAHARPDGDAFGSAFAMTLFLQSQGKTATAYVEEELPEMFEPFAIDGYKHSDIPVDMGQIDYIISCDCANTPRLACPNGLTFADLDKPICNIDHHISNEKYGELNLIDAEAASTTEILTKFHEMNGHSVSSLNADWLMIGLAQDTGCFRFPNTSSQVFKYAGWLLNHGCNYDKVMKELYFNNPMRLLKLQAKVIDNLKFAHDNSVAYFFINQDILDSCDAKVEDVEDLVDVVKSIQGVDIVCRLQQVDNDVRFSFRSQNEKLPVLPIAKKFNGGGHLLACGATMENTTLEEAEAKFLEYLEEVF